jgi:hypothetical protein
LLFYANFALIEISGFSLYLQLLMTGVSIGVHLFNTRNMERNESIIEIITLYVIGLSGWFGIMSGLFGHILYADQSPQASAGP